MPAEKSLKQAAEANPSMLGDPVSIKAESTPSSHTPTEKPSNEPEAPLPKSPSSSSSSSSKSSKDTQSNPANEKKGYELADQKSGHESSKGKNGGGEGKKGGHGGEGKKETLREKAMGANPSLLGDPVSLKAEKADSEPTEQDRGAKGVKSKL